MKTMFITRTEHVRPQILDAEVDDLVLALHDEFPALYVAEVAKADGKVAVVVKTLGDNVPAEAVARLDGWGQGWLTLELVK